MSGLAGKVALVTGGAMGLGTAIAVRLALDGARVFISDVQAELVSAVAAERNFEFLVQDVTNEDQWDEVMKEIRSRAGTIDVLVNNAGIVGPQENASPEEMSLADWKRVFSVNVDGVFLGCRAGIRTMRQSGGGAIVNISSIAGLRASPYATGYGASKATVRHLTKSVAQYCGEKGLNIRCNSVHPGNTRTALYEGWVEKMAAKRGVPVDAILASDVARVPLGRYVQPEDVAAAVAFLASDQARMITGTQIIVDGGVVDCDSFLGSEVYRQKIIALG